MHKYLIKYFKCFFDSKIRVLIIKVFLLLIVSLIACNDEKNESGSNSFLVEGTVVDEYGPLQKAVVSIDDVINWTTETDNNGNFRLENVSRGEHQLLVKSNQHNGGFIEQANTLIVNSDVVIESLKLPKPIQLFEPTSITETSMEIVWIKTDANDFREYKLFRHNTSGLDENTGLLVHVSTSVIDTTFIDEDLLPSENYYYRVYIMNEYGRLGGSNIVSAETFQLNLIVNGNFEQGPDGFSNTWDKIWNAYEYTEILVTDSTSYDGKYSLHFHVPVGETIHETFVAQTLEKNLLTYGEKYEISFMAKFDSFIDENASNGLFIALKWCDGNYFLGEDNITYLSLPESESIDWKEYSFDAEIFENSTKYLRIGMNVNRHGGGIPLKPYNVWLDDFTMVRKN